MEGSRSFSLLSYPTGREGEGLPGSAFSRGEPGMRRDRCIGRLGSNCSHKPYYLPSWPCTSTVLCF